MVGHKNITKNDLQDISLKIRRSILKASFKANACHLGSALSCVEILVSLYYKILKKDDIFLFSKASGVSALYAILADKGYFPKSKIAYYLKKYPLASKKVPGVIHSVGSLGHGLSVAAGMALADRKRKVYVLLSDGECQEGSTYEASLFARQHKLTNLYVTIDFNRYQACGAIKDILDLTTSFDFLKRTLPNLKVVKTIKGKGISFMEDDYTWHYRNLTPFLLKQALKELE